ncbi:hypothetical protein MRX96_029529 [Rhipicephalus microplus]
MDRFLKSSVPNGPSPASPTSAKSGVSGEVAAILSALPEIGPEVELEEEEVPVVPLEGVHMGGDLLHMLPYVNIDW